MNGILSRRVMIFACCGLLSTQVSAEDLMTVFTQARQADPSYRAADATRMATLEARPQARALLLPSLNASATYVEGDKEVDETSFGSPGQVDTETTSYNISLNQPLYHHDYYARLRQANAQVAQAEFDFQQARQDLILRSAQAYFNLLDAQDSLTFARAEKTAIEQQLNQTRQRFNVGLTAITDVHEAQARYDQSVAREIQAENALAIAREALRELIGRQAGEPALLSEKMPLAVPDPQDAEAWVKAALAHNLGLLSTRKAVDAAQASISVARGGHIPTLDLFASHDYTDTKGSFLVEKSTETSVGVKLNVPLFAGGAVSSATRQATYQHQAALDSLEQVRRATERQARNAYLTVVASISSVQALKQALASSNTALEATRAGFEVGTRTAVDVLDSQQALYLAQRNYARSRYDYIMETFRLKQAAGSLSESDLQQVNRWLE